MTAAFDFKLNKFVLNDVETRIASCLNVLNKNKSVQTDIKVKKKSKFQNNECNSL